MQQTQIDYQLGWKRVRLTLLACALASASACAMVDPQNVGTGGYLQVLQGTQIVSETDLSGTGLKSCHQSAYEIMQKNPSIKGRVRCADRSAGDQLPYSFLAHNLMTPQSDEKHITNPFLTRASTSQICQAMLNARKAQEKTVIVEDRCAKPA